MKTKRKPRFKIGDMVMSLREPQYGEGKIVRRRFLIPIDDHEYSVKFDARGIVTRSSKEFVTIEGFAARTLAL